MDIKIYFEVLWNQLLNVYFSAVTIVLSAQLKLDTADVVQQFSKKSRMVAPSEPSIIVT